MPRPRRSSTSCRWKRLCTLPGGDAVFRIGNTNSVDVPYTWDIDKTEFDGSGIAHPGDTYLYVPPSHNNVRVFVNGKQLLAPKQDADLCAFHVRPVKRVDADGHELESPDVPKSWTLTVETKVDTLTCTWKKGDLSCKGGDKGAVDVPFGSSYTITESATPGFQQRARASSARSGGRRTPPRSSTATRTSSSQ